jgi:succinate dehydrogenase/fumarate reductase cytochrome b subunit
MRTTRLRLLHMFTGVVIAVLLGIHMVILHLDAVLGFFGVDATESTSWQAMIERAIQGIWAGIYIVLLAVVLYHALYGLRGKTERIITWSFIITGIIVFIWGAYVPVALLSS